MNKKIKIFSFFSGCGILDLGFEEAGYEIVLVNEYFKPFLDAYIYARKNMKKEPPTYGYSNCDINDYFTEKMEDIKDYLLKAREDGNIIGFIGGPPCPDFSIAGKNMGQHGENGKLSLSYIKLINTLNPDFFLFENVKGLWRTSRHRQFYEELKLLVHGNNYVTTERLTNALEFGVPQDRDRILLFGIKSALLPREYKNENLISNFPWESNIVFSLDKIKSMNWPTETTFSPDSTFACPNNIEKTLTIEHWFSKNEVTKHPNSNCFFKPRAGLIKMQNISEGDVSKKSYKRLHRWRYSPTAAYGNNEVHLHPYKVRRISSAEAMAIQSLPKEFILPENIGLSNMFKTIGNGVPFLLAKGIAKTIKDFVEMI